MFSLTLTLTQQIIKPRVFANGALSSILVVASDTFVCSIEAQSQTEETKMMTMSDDEKLNSFLSCEAVDENFFNEIIERQLNIKRDEFKLRLVFIAPATGKNENYASVVYRAKISIEILATKERQFVSVIVKALLSTIKEFKEFGVFPRERFMYEDVIGSFERIFEERGGEVIKFGPESLAFHADPYEIIVLEDLKASGYEVINRKVGVNLQQAMMVMQKLAKFHAASAIRYQKVRWSQFPLTFY
jgi:hypothetical protein